MRSFQVRLKHIQMSINKFSKDYNKTIIAFYKKYMIIMGSLGHSGFLFQAYKVFLTKSAGDLSLPGFLIIWGSLFSWLFYGVLIKDKVLVIVNIIGTLCVLTMVIAIFVTKV